MPPLVTTVVRWTAIELIANFVIPRFADPALRFPASWIISSVAGWDAARRTKRWHGIVAGGSVAGFSNLVWLASGAPGHADTSDLPSVVAALTYVTLFVSMVAIGAAVARWEQPSENGTDGPLRRT